MDVIAPLIGVVIGGLLTIGGQVLLDRQQTRTAARQNASDLRVTARIHQDHLWTYQSLAARSLISGAWQGELVDDRYKASFSDIRALAYVLDGSDWRLYTSAMRRTSASFKLNSEDPRIMEEILQAYITAEEAWIVLAKISGLEAVPYRLSGQIVLSQDIIERVVASDHIWKIQDWRSRLLNHALPTGS